MIVVTLAVLVGLLNNPLEKRSKIVKDSGEINHQLNCWYEEENIIFNVLYSPTIIELINIIKHLVWRTLKSNQWHVIATILHSLPFATTLTIDLIRVANWWWDKVFLHRLVLYLCIEMNPLSILVVVCPTVLHQVTTTVPGGMIRCRQLLVDTDRWR